MSATVLSSGDLETQEACVETDGYDRAAIITPSALASFRPSDRAMFGTPMCCLPGPCSQYVEVSYITSLYPWSTVEPKMAFCSAMLTLLIKRPKFGVARLVCVLMCTEGTWLLSSGSTKSLPSLIVRVRNKPRSTISAAGSRLRTDFHFGSYLPGSDACSCPESRSSVSGMTTLLTLINACRCA